MLNTVQIMGRLTRDVELRYTPSGTPVGDFAVAVDRKWKNEAGETQEEVSFIDCTAFGRTAETMSQYTRKGHAVCVTGRLKQERWDDKQTGNPRSKLKVVVDRFIFVPGNKQVEGEAPAAQPATRAAGGRAADAGYQPDARDDDNVPF